MRYLVECTYVFEHPYDNSGIQRVVRNVINNLENVHVGIETIPVMIKQGRMYRVERLAPHRVDDKILPWLFKALNFFTLLRNRFWRKHALIESLRPFSKSRNLRRLLFVFCKVFSMFIVVGERLSTELIDFAGKRTEPLEPRSGDVLILLDSSWHSDLFAYVDQLKIQGIKVVSVIYDLIPLTHPQFCDDTLVKVFKNWFAWVSQTADGFIAISKTIRDDTKKYMERYCEKTLLESHWFDYFYLGSELDLAKGTNVRSKVLNAYSLNMPVFLMVSTIEPRKNHVYLIEAFEKIWQQNVDAALCFVGKVGWKCDALMARIENHPELNKRFFVFNDLSDSELEFCYEHASSLVFPSYVEGFGLPIVEGMQRGLPVMASDIPVFREIGGEHSRYFDITQPDSLAKLVMEHCEGNAFAQCEPLANWQWISWAEAAQIFISKINTRLMNSGGCHLGADLVAQSPASESAINP